MSAGAPRVSLLMPCHQQERFVAEAVRAALAQDYEPLEIVIADDASRDATFEIARREVAAVRTRHDVVLYRNETNLGIETYNGLLARSSGRFLVECHGDDVSFPRRVSTLVAAWQRSGASMVSSNAEVLEARGVTGLFFSESERPDLSARGLARSGWNPCLLGATLGYERELLEGFPPLSRRRSPMAMDWLIPFRAALLRGIEVVREPLLRYRVHPDSSTQRMIEANRAEIRREAVFGSWAAQYVYMLECLREFAAARPAADELRALDAELLESIARVAGQWTETRHWLQARRYRLRWIEEAPGRRTRGARLRGWLGRARRLLGPGAAPRKTS